MSRLLAAIVVLAAAPVLAAPAAAPDGRFHGLLDVRAAAGRFDPLTGAEGTITFPRWRVLPTPDSDGLFPDQEPILIQLGDLNQYTLPAGALRAARNGKKFAYRAPAGSGPRMIKRLVLKRQTDGSYAVRLTMMGLDLSRLVIEDPVCLPMAIIVGDDDFFSGVTVTRKSFTAKRVRVDGTCETNTWPWL